MKGNVAIQLISAIIVIHLVMVFLVLPYFHVNIPFFPSLLISVAFIFALKGFGIKVPFAFFNPAVSLALAAILIVSALIMINGIDGLMNIINNQVNTQANIVSISDPSCPTGYHLDQTKTQCIKAIG